nr:hypothetical protein [uncultured Carboxylicivirga sp.]
MSRLDEVLDIKPTQEAVKDLAEASIRNLQAHRELEEFNLKGKFLNKHPLLTTYSLRAELEDLWANNRPEFLEQYANVRDNVKRYTSFLKSDKRKDKRDQDELLLQKHIEKERLMREVSEK